MVGEGKEMGRDKNGKVLKVGDRVRTPPVKGWEHTLKQTSKVTFINEKGHALVKFVRRNKAMEKAFKCSDLEKESYV